ncbi:TPA: 50S ribosome-binding GTPase [Pseudomonas aeruginosa]|uniref:GTPase n=1 Tax=Pseudomonas aeruginosa TaxID=287 RepID=UPI0013869957|nr:GTPase [Pseudomonas aeruginosa]MBO0970568.1 50S ribosome-binding GTPase [Pseudomonas aeruginosa]MBX5510594.1 50S ribosome-binding GTPase [Pseudomonas aeruginosa]MBX5534368.1 50S ribosome-binding GTPase [Pseudomonas aeruginosa]MBX6047553.1 50S ribosome-binding GTPase [Pseudomonas aeruginosa]MCV4098669.1 50S ribosome-binding GTPase [Pseudomonas aeruginosa]
MSNSTVQLVDQLWQHLQGYAHTAQVVSQYHDQWQQFSGQTAIRIVIFGAYDAGKSSLLKRLLVDAGCLVPDWVTISARRETFESREVLAGSITFVDSPGLSSGNDEHDTISRKALQLADAYIWVMPPQLVTSGQSDFVTFLNGGFFHPQLPSAAVTAATIAVVSRMDEAGIDPGDSPDGFAALVEKKTAELSSMLDNDRIAGQLAGLHCIVADPYQLVGNTREPDPTLYDIGREWDGISALRASLEALEGDQRRLRQLAGLRFVCAVARELEEAVRLQNSTLQLETERLSNDSERYGLFRQQLASLTDYTKTDLKARVDEALRSAGRSATVDTQLPFVRLEKTLSEIIDQWASASCSKLQKLAQEFELELQQRAIVVDMSALLAAVQAQDNAKGDSNEQPNSFKQNRKRLFGFVPALAKSAKGLAEVDLGMSLEDARKKLLELEKLKGKALEGAIEKIFKSKEQMEKASSYVRWASAISVVGPLVGQLASFGSDLLEDHTNQQQAAARIEQRKLICQQLDEQADNIREQAQQVFSELSRALDEQLEARQQHCLQSRQAVLEQWQEAEAFVQELHLLLSYVTRMCDA